MNRGSHAGGGFVFTTSWLEGQILVNNRSFAKDNGVRLPEPTTATRSMTLTAS